MNEPKTNKNSIGTSVRIERTATDDLRSYHIASTHIREKLGFAPRHNILDAVSELAAAFDAGQVPDSMSNPLYYNVKRMQELKLA